MGPTMESYSVHSNLRYMGLTFWRPGAVLDAFIGPISPLHAVVPFFMFLAVAEMGNLLALRQGATPDQSPNPFPLILPVAADDYYRFKLGLFPLLNLLALLVFVGVSSGLSRLPSFRGVSTRRATLFLMFLSTVGLPALLCEMQTRSEAPRILAPPLFGMIAVVYLAEFVHREARLARVRAFVFSLVTLSCYFMFRAVTMR